MMLLYYFAYQRRCEATNIKISNYHFVQTFQHKRRVREILLSNPTHNSLPDEIRMSDPWRMIAP